MIPESSAPFVHHILVYLCTNLDNSSVGDSERCDGTHVDIQLCRSTGILFAAWAVGGTVRIAIGYTPKACTHSFIVGTLESLIMPCL